MKNALLVARNPGRWLKMIAPVTTGLSRLGYAVAPYAATSVKEEHIERADLVVMTGWKPAENFIAAYDLCETHGVPSIIISDGYLKRSADSIPRYSSGYWAVSWRGLNSYTKNPFHDAPPERWRALGVELKPWKHDGEVLVVAHQHRQDWRNQRRTEHFRRIMVASLGRRVRVRFHPNHWRGRDFEEFKGHNFETTQARRHARGLTEDLKDAYCLATHDSNAAVVAVINGIPAFELGQTIAYPVTQNGLKFNDRRFPDRDAWTRWLAWQQWTLEEIETGFPFDYLITQNERV